MATRHRSREKAEESIWATLLKAFAKGAAFGAVLTTSILTSAVLLHKAYGYVNGRTKPDLQTYVKTVLISLFGISISEHTCSPTSILSRANSCKVEYNNKQIKQIVRDLLKTQDNHIQELVVRALSKERKVTQDDKVAMWDIITGKEKKLKLNGALML